MSSPFYSRQLDGLRALSVAAVAASHWRPYWDAQPSAFSRAAELGVETFFIISGFLITGILLDNRCEAQKSQVLKIFYCRRFLRIFPLFYLTLAVGLILGTEGLRQSWGWHFGYLSNLCFYLHGWLGHMGHFWSLAVEEQFYLFWPVLMVGLPLRLLPFIFVVCILGAPVYAASMNVSHPGLVNASVLMPSCLGALGLGAFIAFALRRSLPTSWIMRGLLLAGLAGTALWHGFGGAVWLQPLNRLAEDLLLGWLVFATARGLGGPAGWFLSWAPVVYLGKISYGLYVIHGFAWALLNGGLAWLDCPAWMVNFCHGKIAAICLLTAITVGLAALSWHLWERPLNALKRHFPYPANRSDGPVNPVK